MGKRRKARELLLQACYAADLSGGALADCLDDQIARRKPAPETLDFARRLAVKITAHRQETERWLAGMLQNWDPERVGVIERAILLQALTELQHSPDIPWRVVINEACELARRFCDEEAVPFINGVLDRAAAQVLDTKAGDPRKGSA